jgi:hypothetical protein
LQRHYWSADHRLVDGVYAAGFLREVKHLLKQPATLAEGDGTTPETAEMCTDMKGHLNDVCGSCGRPAEQAELLCDLLLTG